jgi:hypothetical protein
MNLQASTWRVAAIKATEMQAHLSKLVPWRYHGNGEPKDTEMKQAREPHKKGLTAPRAAKTKGLKAFTLRDL